MYYKRIKQHGPILAKQVVGSCLFCIHYFPCLVSFGACLETMWRFEQSVYYIGSLGQTHFCMSRGANINLAPNELIYNILCSTFTPTPSMHQKLTEHGKFMYAKQPTLNQNSC